MTPTRIADVIVPEVFNPYVSERFVETADFLLGGIIGKDAEFDQLAVKGGRTINMPFWKNLTGADELLSETVPLTVNKITSGQDIATLFMRGKAWGANDLAAALAGSDPMDAIASQVALYRAQRLQDTLISITLGVLADNIANDSGDMLNKVAVEIVGSQSDATMISSDSLIDAMGTMGDKWSELTAIAIHSVVFRRLQKMDQIVYVDIAGNIRTTDQAKAVSEGVLQIPTWLGRRVIVNDNMPTRAGTTSGTVYTSILFGQGAFALGEGAPKVPTETDRDSLQGDDILVHRWHQIFHPRGIAFQDASVAGEAPTNAEMEDATNWDRVYDRKNVKFAYLQTNG